jgi:hypothetical protein
MHYNLHAPNNSLTTLTESLTPSTPHSLNTQLINLSNTHSLASS